jgi:hypothetical protein
MEHPCKNCIVKVMCIDACQKFIEYTRIDNKHGLEDMDILMVFKRCISAITKIQ